VAQEPGVSTVTFLLTDVEGSSGHWEASPASMRRAIELHDRLVATAVERAAGRVLTSHGEGDSFFAVFPRPLDAVIAARAIQEDVAAQAWPAGTSLRVRIAIHTGAAGPDYRGPAANRCARLRAAAHGRQVLVSGVTAGLVRDRLPAGLELVDLGEHGLRGLDVRERVFQVVIPGHPARFPPLRSLDAFSNNLPSHLSSFVGRETSIEAVRALLAGTRVLTLVGPGGIGKTRLALQVAESVLSDYPDGVWLVDLASVADPATVPQTALTAMGLVESPGRPPIEVLRQHLAGRRALLLLDNCEHLVAASARLSETVLRNSPMVRVLATSRERLRVPGEQVWPVPPLSIADAVRLFETRATRARSGFRVGAENGPQVTQLCARLDGIPLALELAAAQVAALSPAEVLRKLDDRFRLLAGGGGGDARHHTMRATVAWSYNLLAERERVLLRRLGVFAGSFDLHAVDEVCAFPPLARPETVELMVRLVDTSLVVADQTPDGACRYHLLDTLRHYAQERLDAAGERAELRARHARHYARVAEGLELSLYTTDEQLPLVRRLDPEHDNVRVALRWAAEGDPEQALALAAAWWPFWWVRSFWSEAREWLEWTLAGASSRGLARARALGGLGCLALFRDHAAAPARRLFEEALAIAEAQGDRWTIAHLRNWLGVAAAGEDRMDVARDHFLHARDIAAGIELHGLHAIALTNLGECDVALGDHDLARTRGAEAAELLARVGPLRIGVPALVSLAQFECHVGRHAAALTHLQAALEVVAPDNRFNVARLLETCAFLAAWTDQPLAALTLSGCAATLYAALDAPPPAYTYRAEAEARLAAMRRALGERVAAEAAARGARLPVEEAMATARSLRV
jgi:predicted ATPase/class 3 adenylate cyclase